jgi:outer membrane lipoprotein-sorting protein
LLLGEGHLLDSFVAAVVQLKQPVFPGSKQVKLTPRKPTDGVEVVYLEVDARTHSIGRILLIDPLGNESDLVLDKLTEGPRLADDTFTVRLPPGVTTRDATSSEVR